MVMSLLFELWIPQLDAVVGCWTNAQIQSRVLRIVEPASRTANRKHCCGRVP